MSLPFTERVRKHIVDNFCDGEPNCQYLGSPNFLYRGERGPSGGKSDSPTKLKRWVSQGGLGKPQDKYFCNNDGKWHEGVWEFFLSDSMQYSLVDFTSEDGMFVMARRGILDGKYAPYSEMSGYDVLSAKPVSPGHVERILVPRDAQKAIVEATVEDLQRDPEVVRRHGKEINFFGDKPLKEAVVGV